MQSVGYLLVLFSLVGVILVGLGVVQGWTTYRRRRDWIHDTGWAVGTVEAPQGRARTRVLERRVASGHVYRTLGSHTASWIPRTGYPHPIGLLVDPTDESHFVDNPGVLDSYGGPLAFVSCGGVCLLITGAMWPILHVMGALA